VLRHSPREQGWAPAAQAEPGNAEAIEAHVERYFGKPTFVWHEIASDLVHLDVHVIEPTPERPWFTLFTTGMSDLPMTVPDGAGVSPYAELMICLPPDWPLAESSMSNESSYWPVRLLKMVARLPHEYSTWIGAWHSVPNGDPAEPYAPGTPFTGVVVTPVLNCPPEARAITTGSGKEISLLALVPLHPAEMELKFTQGTDALIAALDRANASDVLDPARPSGA
jgi:hypothetical protein